MVFLQFPFCLDSLSQQPSVQPRLLPPPPISVEAASTAILGKVSEFIFFFSLSSPGS